MMARIVNGLFVQSTITSTLTGRIGTDIHERGDHRQEVRRADTKVAWQFVSLLSYSYLCKNFDRFVAIRPALDSGLTFTNREGIR